VNKTNDPHYTGNKITYKRVNEVDYSIAHHTHGPLRVTLDANRRIKRIIKKTRIKDINFLCPQSVVDFRISASTEVDFGTGIQIRELPKHGRQKERLSYQFELFSVDLTKVEQGDWEGTRTVYETEIELVEMHVLRAEKEKRESGMPNDFMTIATALVNNIRAFLLIAKEFQQYSLPPDTSKS